MVKMFWRKPTQPAAILACLLLSGSYASGQEVISSGFRIKASEVVLPPDATLGEYQRMTRPFENWTLICDENLKKRRRVCNVTQIIENQAGQMAFSWSLAATQQGNPYMILRTAPVADASGKITFNFEGRDKPVQVEIDGCNQTICLGMLPVGPIMREQISKDAEPTISYPTRDGKVIRVQANLSGLSAAVEAIK